MSRPYKITIEASKKRKGVLDVHDAMQQVGDFFRILKGRNEKEVLLDIAKVSRRNPLIVECVPRNPETLNVDYEIVEPNARAFHELYEDISSGRTWNPDMPRFVRDSTKRILQRNTNGIESTIFELRHTDDTLEIEIRPDSARRGLRMLELPPDPIYVSVLRGGKHTELGSVEGPIVALARHYGKPAIKIEVRSLGREVWCRLSDDELSKWETKITASHPWRGRRVSVHGEILYGENGELQKVNNGRVEIMKDSDLPLEDFFDSDFTGGLPAREYLDRLHEGNYGDTA